MRNIGGKDFRSHTEPLFKKYDILKFGDLLSYNQCTFMHKLLNEKQSDSFHNFFKKPANFNGDTNRRAFCYYLDKLKNVSLSKFPSASLPRAWNDLDQNTKILESHSKFKKTVYENLIDKYASHIHCHSPSCPDFS